MRSHWWIVVLACAPLVACHSHGPDMVPPPPPPSGPLLPPAQALPPPAVPTGLRDQETDPSFVLVASIAPVAPNTDTSLTLELHGAGGYHVNEQYPIRVDLETQNATTPKSSLRRTDAAQYEQAGARFAVPVHTTGAGAVVRGRAVFAVCSAENCVPQTRQFAVSLP